MKFLFSSFALLVIAGASHAQHAFSGLVLDVSANKYQNSVGVGLKRINNYRDSVVINTHYSFQVCPFFLDWTFSDPYNNNSANSSLLSLYNWGWVCISVIGSMAITRIGDEAPQPSWVYYVVFGPSFLINSQHNFVFLGTKTGERNFIWTSVFVKTKLDYFEQKENKWWRYKPGFGIELINMVKLTQEADVGLAFDAGFDKPLDYAHGKWQSNDLVPMMSIKVLFSQ